ncbi:MAG TPA: hypothetical protein VKG43_04820 [Acidimicrobiales bacterium]|nr:hypothetical protein [Acidimicrobiales bacterium]
MPDGIFPVEVVTPEAALVDGTASAVVLRSSDGDLTVLDGHTALVTDVVPGEVRIEQADGSTLALAEHGGFLYVDTSPGAAERAEGTAGPAEGAPAGLSTRVTLLFGVAELADQIDVARARAARDRATARLDEVRAAGRGTTEPGAEGVLSETDLEMAELAAALRRAEVRLEVTGETSG